MARALRIQHKGAWYHVMNRGIDRGRLFRNDRDRQHLLELLGVLSERYGVEVHAYVLKEASSMQEAAERLTVLRAYRWSSYRAYAGYQAAPDWLRMDEILGRAGGNSQTVRQRHYRKEVEGYLRGGYKDALAMRLRNAIAVGADGFANKVKQGLGIVPREWSGKRELRGRKTFAEVVQAVARECTGLTLAELGEAAGGMDYAAVSEAVRRVAFRRRPSEQPLAQVFQRVNKLLNI